MSETVPRVFDTVAEKGARRDGARAGAEERPSSPSSSDAHAKPRNEEETDRAGDEEAPLKNEDVIEERRQRPSPPND